MCMKCRTVIPKRLDDLVPSSCRQRARCDTSRSVGNADALLLQLR